MQMFLTFETLNDLLRIKIMIKFKFMKLSFIIVIVNITEITKTTNIILKFVEEISLIFDKIMLAVMK